MGQRIIEVTADRPELSPDSPSSTEIAALRRLAEDRGLTYTMHASFRGLNPAAPDFETRKRTADELVRALMVAEALKCESMVMHIGEKKSSNIPLAQLVDGLVDTVKTVAAAAESRGIRLMIENTGWGSMGILRQSSDLIDIARACGENTALLLDTGHALLQGFDPIQCFMEWMPKLTGIHASDNMRVEDEHLPIGRGVTDWTSLMSAIRKHSWNGLFMVEIRAHGDPASALTSSLTTINR